MFNMLNVVEEGSFCGGSDGLRIIFELFFHRVIDFDGL